MARGKCIIRGMPTLYCQKRIFVVRLITAQANINFMRPEAANSRCIPPLTDSYTIMVGHELLRYCIGHILSILINAITRSPIGVILAARNHLCNII